MKRVFIKKRILIISPDPWDHNFVSKHHYAQTLAELGNTVFFLDPPGNEWSVRPITMPSLCILNYVHPRGINKVPTFVSDLVSRFVIRKIIKLAGGPFDIVWSFDPYRFQNLSLFKARHALYFAADLHDNRSLEKRIASSTHYVLSPSKLILDGIDTSSKKIHFEHGIAEYFFSTHHSITLPGNNKIKVGYVGNLMIKSLDKNLLMRLIEKFSQLDFIFVGDERSTSNDITWNAIRKFANVFFLGTLPHNQVPSFLKSCDMLLLAYDTEKYKVEASNSHKILEYLSSGRVVVSTPIAEYIGKEVVSMPPDYSSFESHFEEVANNLSAHNSVDQAQKRIDFAFHRTYKKLIGKLDALINE